MSRSAWRLGAEGPEEGEGLLQEGLAKGFEGGFVLELGVVGHGVAEPLDGVDGLFFAFLGAGSLLVEERCWTT